VLWLITVAAFLGTVLAGVFAFFLFSQRDRIRDALKTPVQRRVESRTPARVEVQLLGTRVPFINEITFTHNVSQYGARVISKTKWRPNDELTLKLLRGRSV
jgi:plastocyanin